MKFNSQWLLVFILFGSCNNDSLPTFMGKKPIPIEFEKSYTLKGIQSFDEVIGVDNIHVMDSLVIFSTPALDTLYQIYSVKTLNPIGNFVRKGDGPNELSHALKPLSGTKKNNEFLISFYNKARFGIFHLNLSQSLKHGIAVFQDTINLENYTEIYRAYQINKDEIFVDNLDFLNLNQIYSTYDFTKKQIIQSDTALISGLHNQSEIYMMATCTVFNKDQKKYAGGMIFQDQINIYDSNNPEKSFSLSVSRNTSSLFEASQIIMPLKKEYYVDLRDGREALFALYANQSRKEWATGDKPAEIHVINWEGQPLCKISTNEKLLHFDIDPNYNTLYGLTEKGELYVYDLEQIPELKYFPQ